MKILSLLFFSSLCVYLLSIPVKADTDTDSSRSLDETIISSDPLFYTNTSLSPSSFLDILSSPNVIKKSKNGEQCRTPRGVGVCGDVINCKNGAIVPGFCTGSATVQCCVNGVRPKRVAGSFHSTRRRISQSASVRNQETEHKKKWEQYKKEILKGKPIKNEAAKYQNFKQNRIKNIQLNEKYGNGHVLFSSLSPFSHLSDSEFQRLKLGGGKKGGHQSASASSSRQSQSTSNSYKPPQNKNKRKNAALLQMENFFKQQHQADTEKYTPTPAELQEVKNLLAKIPASKTTTTTAAPVNNPKSNSKSKSKSPSPQASRADLVSPKSKSSTTTTTTTANSKSSPSVVYQSSSTLLVDFVHLLTPVKEQGDCGSCWAFAAAATAESLYYKNYGTMKTFSTQQLVDCAGPKGCEGSFSKSAFEYWMNNPIALDSAYPYYSGKLNDNGPCRPIAAASTSAAQGSKIKSIINVSVQWYRANNQNENELNLLAALRKFGPLTVFVNANREWQNYKSGEIFPSALCSSGFMDANHFVQLVGFGHENGKKFWLVRNSWSSAWGEQGFMRLEAFSGKGACGIASGALSVTL